MAGKPFPSRSRLAALAKAMPKIDLHYHLEGGVRPETLASITGNPDIGEIRRQLTVPAGCRSLSQFLKRFDYVTPLLRSPRALSMAAQAAMAEAAAQNLCYLEVRFAPAYLATPEMDVPGAIAAVLDGLDQGSRRWGIPAAAILTLGLTTPVEENEAILRAALPWLGSGLAAVDVAGPEGEISLAAQASALALARKLGFPLTLHAGEAAPASAIARAVELDARRIGHGTSLWQDKPLMERLARQKIGLEMCPTSNFQTRAIRSWEEYHIREYFDAGIPVTICTDDPAISGITLTGEYLLAMTELGFTPEEMKQMVLYGIQMSFASRTMKQSLQNRVEQAFACLEF